MSYGLSDTNEFYNEKCSMVTFTGILNIRRTMPSSYKYASSLIRDSSMFKYINFALFLISLRSAKNVFY